MQKWSPKSFADDAEPPLSALVDPAEFEASGAAVLGAHGPAVDDRQFRREAGFSDPKSLMNSLTPEERSQVYELVEMDLKEEYEAREGDLKAQFETDLAASQAESATNFERWTTEMAAILAGDIQDAAEAAARLAVQIAGKIVRQAVVTDPDVLARAIETTIFKISENTPLTIRAHPDDAEWLNEQSPLRDRLRIASVVADRRVERGGCLIQSGTREWDATLGRQLGTLEEIVNEMISTSAGNPAGSSATGSTATEESETETRDQPEAGDDPSLA